MSQHFDALETRAPEVREAALMAALPAQVAHAKAKAPAFADLLKDVDVLLVSKCSLNPDNRTYLSRIYRVEIELKWYLKAQLRCWDVYTRPLP